MLTIIVCIYPRDILVHLHVREDAPLHSRPGEVPHDIKVRKLAQDFQVGYPRLTYQNVPILMHYDVLNLNISIETIFLNTIWTIATQQIFDLVIYYLILSEKNYSEETTKKTLRYHRVEAMLTSYKHTSQNDNFYE